MESSFETHAAAAGAANGSAIKHRSWEGTCWSPYTWPRITRALSKTSLIAQVEAEGEICPLVFLVCLWVVGLGFLGFYFWFCLAVFFSPSISLSLITKKRPLTTLLTHSSEQLDSKMSRPSVYLSAA